MSIVSSCWSLLTAGWRRYQALGNCGRGVFVVVLYVALAFWSTWPLPRFATTALPIGDLACGTVPLFNLWSLWWNADRATHAFSGYWDAPIFHPEAGAFAFSEPQPMTLLVAPVIWLTGSRALAYNLYLWVSLVLNAVFAERLLRIVGVRRWLAVFGGLLVLTLPIVHWQIDVLQLVPMWGTLWLWTALWQMSLRPRLWTGLELGLAMGAAFWACGHHGVFLALLVAVTCWGLRWRICHWRWWVGGGLAVVIAAALIAPLAIPLRNVTRHHEFVRDPALVTQLSAIPGDYTSSSGIPLFAQPRWGSRPGWHLSPGWGKWCVAGIGVLLGLWRRRWRRWTWFLMALLLGSLLLSLGPNLKLGSWQPWWTITEYVPGFSQVRNVFRFAFFSQLVVVLLGVQGVALLWAIGRWRFRFRGHRLVTGLCVGGLACVLLLEVRPRTPQMSFVPDARRHADWADFVRRETPPGRAILCLPMSTGDNVGDYELTTRWMYMGTYHGVPLVNGYSGFFPASYFEIQTAVNTKFPDRAVCERLLAENVEFLVVDAVALRTRYYATTRFPGIRLDLVHTSPMGIEVYRLRRVPVAG